MTQLFTTSSRVGSIPIYPFERGPEIGSGCYETIVSGLRWAKMPCGEGLEFVNVWCLDDVDGVVLIDTGEKSEEIADIWQNILAGELSGQSVKALILTHCHPDHAGLAGRLVDWCGAKLCLTELEYKTGCAMLDGTETRETEKSRRFYQAAGWNRAIAEKYNAQYSALAEIMDPLPDAFDTLTDGQILEIGSRRWQIVVGSGHSPEHACLYCADDEIFISGDQVLPRIFPNVSVRASEPDADPIAGWISSLKRIKSIVPDEVLVLPSHGNPFYGFHARIDDLIRRHETRMENVVAALDRPKTLSELFPVMFGRPIVGMHFLLASGEGVATLNALKNLGRVTMDVDAEGIGWWRAV